MADHPTTFGEGTPKNGIEWDDMAALHREDDGDGIFEDAKSLNRGTFAEMIAFVMALPEGDRHKYVIQKAGDRMFRYPEIRELSEHPEYPGRV